MGFSRSERKEHRAAEVVPRSGPIEPRDLVATRGVDPFGNAGEINEGKFPPEPSKGMAPQPGEFQCFSVWGLGLSTTIYFSKGFGFLVCLIASVAAMEAEDVSHDIFGQFFEILDAFYAMMVILVWEIFRWLVSHVILVVAPRYNQRMVEQAELMIKLALKDQGTAVRGEEGRPVATPTGAEKDEPREEETRPGEDHRSEKRRKTEERDAERAHEKREERGRDRWRRGKTRRPRSPHKESESTARRSERKRSPDPTTTGSQRSGRADKGPIIAPLPAGMGTPKGPPPKKTACGCAKDGRRIAHR